MAFSNTWFEKRLVSLIESIKESVEYSNVKNVMYYVGLAEGILEVLGELEELDHYFDTSPWQEKINEAMGDYY